MPEVRECDASGRIIRWGFDSARAAGANLTVQGLYCTEAEKRGADAQDGLPIQIDSKCTLIRGGTNKQTKLYPQLLGSAPVSTLCLNAITATYRTVFLHLGTLNLRYISLFSPDVWDSSVMVVHRKVRGFKVALALVFADYVLAFLSHDLATWMLPKVPLLSPPSVYHAPKPNKRTGTRLATDAVRSLQDIFHSVGAYTSQELFYMAGISPFLTEREVFLNPSRTARLIAALYTFIKYGEDNIEKLLRAAMLEGVLAPTIDQRKFYAYWLYVWAKDEIRMSVRMKVLVQEYNVSTSGNIQRSRSSLTELFDVFEPSLIEGGINALDLGHLVFGKQARDSHGLEFSTASKNDKLMDLYRRNGILDTPTRLKYYSPLFLDENLLSKAVVPVHAYSAPRTPRYHEDRIARGTERRTGAVGSSRKVLTSAESSKLRKVIGRFNAGYKRARVEEDENADLTAGERPKIKKRRLEVCKELTSMVLYRFPRYVSRSTRRIAAREKHKRAAVVDAKVRLREVTVAETKYHLKKATEAAESDPSPSAKAKVKALNKQLREAKVGVKKAKAEAKSNSSGRVQNKQRIGSRKLTFADTDAPSSLPHPVSQVPDPIAHSHAEKDVVGPPVRRTTRVSRPTAELVPAPAAQSSEPAVPAIAHGGPATRRPQPKRRGAARAGSAPPRKRAKPLDLDWGLFVDGKEMPAREYAHIYPDDFAVRYPEYLPLIDREM
ncbi:hypothetical protein C8F01DRAFT_1253247 [Mycena amicta]|nr:hypothetical protein C8F01DRAFT_1253247 [Mycena amicta]